MKKLALYFMALLPIAGLVFPALADDSSKQDDPKRIIVVPRPVHRPKAPSRQAVTCLYYSDGTLSIEFLYSEGNYSLSITQSEEELATVFNLSSDQIETIYVGNLTDAEICIETEDGHTYYGTINN
ncbi:MAG: hypothetical protein HDR75_03345 [Bacteroides sp.]|nr:hypothetical protein [Bacteroides sp.]